jgi:uncharacterized membrane protein YhaH (DUF805 family)
MKTHINEDSDDPVLTGRLGQTYDKFFASKSRVDGVQFLGLILLGGSLIVAAIFVVVLTLSGMSHSRQGMAEAILMLIVLAICIPIAVFGALHIRRAFAGRH